MKQEDISRRNEERRNKWPSVRTRVMGNLSPLSKYGHSGSYQIGGSPSGDELPGSPARRRAEYDFSNRFHNVVGMNMGNTMGGLWSNSPGANFDDIGRDHWAPNFISSTGMQSGGKRYVA